MILLTHFDIPYGFRLGKISYEVPFQGPVFFALSHEETYHVKYALEEVMIYIRMSVVTSQMKRSILIDGNAVGITIKSWLKEIVDQNCIHFQIIFHI